jgi:hypothetical protein
MALIAGDTPQDPVAAFKAALAQGAPTSPAKQDVSPYQIPIWFGNYVSAGPGPGHTNQFHGGDNPDGPNAPKFHTGQNVHNYDLTDTGINAAVAAWYQFDDEHRKALMNRMWYLGLIKSPTDFDGAYQMWGNAVQHAARFANAGKPIDPKDMLEMLADGKQGAGPKQQQTVSRSIDLTDPETAKAWVTQAYMQSMGRAPEDAEVRAMADALMAQEKAHPRITTTTTTQHFDAAGNPVNQDQSSTTSGGVDAQAFLANQINADPESVAHQAAAQYLPALHALLGAGV